MMVMVMMTWAYSEMLKRMVTDDPVDVRWKFSGNFGVQRK